jgi:hypothetical protein
VRIYRWPRSRVPFCLFDGITHQINGIMRQIIDLPLFSIGLRQRNRFLILYSIAVASGRSSPQLCCRYLSGESRGYVP